jgi:hypothetical protein
MQSLCITTYNELLLKYKPVSAAYFASRPSERVTQKINLEAKINRLVKNLEFTENDFDGNNLKLETRDQIILDLCNKISNKKPKPKSNPNVPRVRDRNCYTFNGNTYGKGPIVHAVVKEYLKKNPNKTLEDIKKVFPDYLQRNYGIVQSVEKARLLSGKHNRFFLKDNQLIQIKDTTVAICNQFTGANIEPFLKHAAMLGFIIEK